MEGDRARSGLMSRGWVRPVLLAVLIAGVVGVSAVSVFDVRLGSMNLGRGSFWFFPLLAAYFFLVPGVIVLIRADWHPVGWFLCNLALGFLFAFPPDNPTLVPNGDLEIWWIWLSHVWISSLFFTVWSGLILVFPDGFAGRSRRRWPALLVLGIGSACIVLVAFQANMYTAPHASVPNPMPFNIVPDAIGGVAGNVPLLLLPVVMVGFVRRFRRAEAAGRRQYKWVVVAFVYVAVGLAVAIAVSSVAGGTTNPIWFLVVIGYLLVPIAFMVSILKFRLYSVDKVVSRTLTYGVVAVLVGLIYSVPVLALGDSLGRSSDIVVAASTLAAAAAFSPIRRRIQRLVERRFNRARYDADQVVEEYAKRLREQVDLGTITDDLRQAIAGTVQPSHAALWVRTPFERGNPIS